MKSIKGNFALLQVRSYVNKVRERLFGSQEVLVFIHQVSVSCFPSAD